MKILDIELYEYADAFGRITQKYYLEYMISKGLKVDWIAKMLWASYTSAFHKLVEEGKISGEKADNKYWITLFKNDPDNIYTFIQMIKTFTGK